MPNKIEKICKKQEKEKKRTGQTIYAKHNYNNKANASQTEDGFNTQKRI